MKKDDIKTYSLSESSNSFMAPAFTVAKIIEEKKSGRYGVCSFSPTANAVATIEVKIA